MFFTTVELADFLESCLEKVKQLSALKFTDGNFLRLTQIMLRCSDRMNIMNGHEETLLPSMVLGCRAAICATASLPKAPELMNTIFDPLIDLSRKSQAQKSLVEIVDKVKKTGNGNFFLGLKTLLNQANSDIQFGLPRAPVYVPKQN